MSKANPQPNSRRTIYIIGGLAVVILIVFNMSGSDSSTTKPLAATKKSSSTTAPGQDLIKPEDYDIRFASLKNDPIKDNFRPLVGKIVAPPPEVSGGISIDLAGEDGWGYTGMATVDGKAQATLENSKTGETNFVGVGEHWKKATMKSISDFQVVMIDQKGKAVSVKMGDGLEAKKAGEPMLSAAVAPPPMNGAIGPLSVTPMTIAPDAVAPTAAFPQQGGRGRRGRRGRNNGGNAAQGTDNGDQNGS